ncbi:MAG: VWA domain-containing protein, partial [Salinibacter sp.]
MDRTRLPLTQWSREIHVRQETARYFADQEWANLRPKTPQTFHSYRRVTPQLWCQVLTPESEGTELITTVTIAPGDTTVATSSLPSGRYLVRCGTTIQVDAVDAIDTGIEAKSVDKTSSNFPQVPLGGVDDRGRWETARLLDISTKQYETKMGMPEQRYTYRILKRYTYNTVSTTITHLAPGETDRAFVPLLTHPDALATLSEQLAESRRIADFDLQESATNQTVQGLLSSGLEETFKASLPTPSGAVGPGLLAGEVANLVYLGTTQPSTELDEQFLLRFGADIAVSALSIKVATAAGSAGGPAGTAAGLAVGVAVGTAVDQVISSYFESRVRGLVGEAFFDDLTASVSEVTSGQLSVQINCLGLRAGQLQLNTATPNNRSQPKSTCEGALSSATFTVPYTGDPQHFLSGCGPSLVANVPIVHGSSERLRLSTCLSDLVDAVPETPSPPDPLPEEPAASSTMLVIDTSGSMEWEDPTGMAKIDAAKDAARRFVDMVETENRRHGTSHEIGIVQFNTSASVRL